MSAAVEIRHLRTFLAVAEAESFTRAAERLGISQPGISQQIKDLEEALGASLLDRRGKVVRLTQAGSAFRSAAEVVLRKMDEACASVLPIEGMTTGHLDVGVFPPVCVSWMPAVLARFAETHPGVTVTVHERASNVIETEVEAGRFDLGIGILSYASPNVDYEHLASASIALVVPEKHPLARRASVTIRDLEETRLVLLPESFQLREVVEDAFLRAKHRPRVAYEIDNLDAILAVVARTGTPTLLPALVLEGSALRLRAVPLTSPSRRLDFGLMWPRGSHHGPAAKPFAEAVIEIARGAAPVRRRGRGEGG